MNYQVQAIKLGEFGAVPGPELYWMGNFDTWDKLFVIGVVIQGDGKTILINSGPPLDLLPTMNQNWRKFFGRSDVDLTVKEDERIERALARVGVKSNDVDYVFVTPFQAYAIGGVDKFPKAQICLSRKGWIDFHAPRWRQHPHDFRPFCIPDTILIHLVTEAWSRVRLLEEEEEVLPGISVFWTGVHHRNSVAVKIKTKKGNVIASDCFFKYENIEKMRPLGINESMEECLTAYHRIKKEADILLPLYDYEVFKRHPRGKIA
jgi:glyoxylase-like metal-dependent hydrolase (beta-lactamase superfamily II)